MTLSYAERWSASPLITSIGPCDASNVWWGRLARFYLIGDDNSRDQIHKRAARWR